MKKITTSIKEALIYTRDTIQRLKDTNQAKQDTSVFCPLVNVVGQFGNYVIFHNNKLVLAMTGNYSHEPGIVCTTERQILVNDAFLKFPEDVQQAFICHEQGHLELEHTRPFLYILQILLGFGKGMEMEYEADKYSFEKGYNMLKAVEYFEEAIAHQGTARSTKLRIKRLKELSNEI
jgi:Zn-dependent protease with chaperone function